jgi:photosystem II stability/assembly factor-like uncharacterized protein
MKWHLALGTSNGVIQVGYDEDNWQVVRRGLSGRTVTGIAACAGTILAGTLDGVARSDDGGVTWHNANDGLTVQHVRWLAYASADETLALIGTEPATIHRLTGAEPWRECPEVAQLRDAQGWWLPYSPEAGCVRGFASTGAARVYAAVEVGGVLRSDDGGQTWSMVAGSGGNPRDMQPPAPLIHPDVHSISVHPSSSDRVTAPTGGGLYRSEDGGATWTLLYACYCRAAWVDPEDPAHIVFGPADGVSRNGRIEESLDGGRAWRLASEGQDVPWPQHMVERFLQVGDTLLAVLSNGQLLAANLATLSWHQILPEVTGVRCVIPL